MPHARHRTTDRRPVPRAALPALLLTIAGTAFGGLVALAPAASEPRPAVLAYTAELTVPSTAPVERERTVSRASRSRTLAARAAAEAKAKADAAARAAAAAKAAAEAKAKAEAAAKAKAAAEAKAKARSAALASARAAQLRAGGVCPVPSASFTDTWGAARSGGRAHKGTDMMASYGAPVYAVASGRVRTASSAAGGISLYLDADNGETYFYAHNSANLVSTGERVSAGDLVARVGTSGNAPESAPHVHFERQVDGRAVNPYPFLRRIC